MGEDPAAHKAWGLGRELRPRMAEVLDIGVGESDKTGQEGCYRVEGHVVVLRMVGGDVQG